MTCCPRSTQLLCQQRKFMLIREIEFPRGESTLHGGEGRSIRDGEGEESGGAGRTGACTYAARRFDKTWKGPQLSASQQQRALHTTYMYTHTHNTTSHVGVPIYHVCLERQHFVRVCVYWLGIVARPQKSAHWRLRTPLHPSVTRPPSRHAIQLTADTQLSVVEWS